MSDKSGPQNILFLSSTFPATSDDPVPAFVKDEAIWLKKMYPEITLTILAPHSAYSHTKKYTEHTYYNEYRFHYFWPFRWEKLAGRGIQPALKKNKLLFFELPPLFIAEFFATWKYVRKLKPDLIYAHWFTPQALIGSLVSKITKTPFVFDTQASDAIVLKKVPFSRKIVAAVCRQAYAYTAPSQQTVDKLLYFSTDRNRKEIMSKLHVIPLGTTPVPVREKTIERVKKQYGLTGKKCLFFIGRLVDRKGVDILIRAFSDMVQKDPSLHLIIVGDGQDRKNLESLASKLNVLNCITFTGFITGEDRFALLELSDVCVIPSINVGDQAEGLPIVFMEAVTKGKVVVLSDATGAHEVVKDGVNAFIAKAGSEESLKTNLLKALEISQSGNAAFYKAVAKLAKQFQWPSIVQRRYEAFRYKS